LLRTRDGSPAPNQAPGVDVIAVVLVVVSILPAWLAQRLGGTDAAESRL
jgi:putative spermidine/putrescine transport system permease protein